ncbi:MAG: hypothetical protein OXF24_01670 [Hyphomicrobiales bacterium]|nr:hypothetical protein [Hyphomicrobiales bacterium]MCY4052936.1 hypothetical protein [Hyphomicrobiales bacterium]
MDFFMILVIADFISDMFSGGGDSPESSAPDIDSPETTENDEWSLLGGSDDGDYDSGDYPDSMGDDFGGDW